MNTFSRVQYLAPTNSLLLDGITSHNRKLILGVAECRRVSAKDILIQGGAKATHLFLLRSGGATYYRTTKGGEAHLLRWLIPGDVFGIGTLFTHAADYMGSVQAAYDCWVYSWAHSDLRDLSCVYPQLAENALRIALGYISAYAERHLHLLTGTAEQRLACALVHLGHRTGRCHPAGIEVKITNEQLGRLAHVGLPNATRLLRKWERKRAITKHRGKILIHAPETLIVD
jgi:CRP-like cAMP-binding protein